MAKETKNKNIHEITVKIEGAEWEKAKENAYKDKCKLITDFVPCCI